MDETNNDIIIKLMQNVSDKLDDISKEISLLNTTSKEDKLLPEKKSFLKDIIESQKMICDSLSGFGDTLKEKPSVINQSDSTKYIIFGKDTPFSSRLLLILIAVVLISIPFFKHIPPYLNEKSTIKQERDTYRLFYNSEFLKTFEERKVVPFNMIKKLELLKSRDSAFMRELEVLNSKYSVFLKKEELKAELKKLQE